MADNAKRDEAPTKLSSYVPQKHIVAEPFAHTSGPRDARIALVGEAWGEEEARVGLPFVGAAGHELTRLLRDAGIKRSECFLTNVIAARPYCDTEFGRSYSNDFDLLCTTRAGVLGTSAESLSPLGTGKYLRPEFVGELDRLRAELETVRPNIVVALGAKASWALLGNAAIGKIRGSTALSVDGQKVLATYHPSYLFRVWSDRTIVVADLMKAKRESAFAEIRRPERYVLVAPTWEEMLDWRNEHIPNAKLLSIDIETKRGQIECVGFATSARDALCVPFMNPNGSSYWATAAEEYRAWGFVRELCESDIPKLFQNGAGFDMLWLWRAGIKCRIARADPMLAHHALLPEMPKGLGFMASYLTDESSWKLMRGKHTSEMKREDE